MSPWVRRCLTVACVLAAWLVARPAAAAAPLCDERGASMLAPLPVLDSPNASIDIGEHPDGCDASALRDKAYHRGERPSRLGSSGHAPMTLASAACEVASPAAERFSAPGTTTYPHPGVRSAVERPPRPRA